MIGGTIEINGQVLGRWEAQNINNVMRGVAEYRCQAWYRNQEGYPFHADFKMKHVTGMGAWVLAWRVMATAEKKFKGYPPGTDKEFPV